MERLRHLELYKDLWICCIAAQVLQEEPWQNACSHERTHFSDKYLLTEGDRVPRLQCQDPL